MRKIHKKLLCLFFLSLCGAAFSVQYWGDGAFAEFGYSSGTGIKVPLEGVAGIRYSVPKAQFSALGGLNGFGADFSFGAQVEPLTFGIFSLGLKYVFHIGKAFPDDWGLDFYEYDHNMYLSFLFRGKDRINPVKTIVSFGFDVKNSVFGLTNNTLRFQEAFPALEVQVTKRFLQAHEFMFRFATFDYLYFKRFLNIWWQLGYSYDINPLWTGGGLFEISYADQITNSGTFGGFQGKVFGVYKFKKRGLQ